MILRNLLTGGYFHSSFLIDPAFYYLNPQDNSPSSTRATAKMIPLTRGVMAPTSKRIARTTQIPVNIVTANFLFTVHL
jgi:hypothetical protein